MFFGASIPMYTPLTVSIKNARESNFDNVKISLKSHASMTTDTGTNEKPKVVDSSPFQISFLFFDISQIEPEILINGF